MPIAWRHVMISVSSAVITRPDIPPTALPLMYNPMAVAMELVSSSSPKYAMATEGTPASAAPCNNLITNNEVKLPLQAVISASNEVQRSDRIINAFRPKLSDVIPENSRPIAKIAVLIDNGRLPSAGETANSFVNTGRSG